MEYDSKTLKKDEDEKIRRKNYEKDTELTEINVIHVKPFERDETLQEKRRVQFQKKSNHFGRNLKKEHVI